ncbi:MAG: SOS response-associated peptidase, partial [Bifidobacteriaceae bacterium]|nr:SOS response-associated peptidase [Bifidobacteriaceae bacterium]
VSPGQAINLVRLDEDVPGRVLATARWGLVPAWSKDPAAGPKPINARSETVTVKPYFRAAARRRRALVPAGGYYEWQAGPGRAKTPFYLHPEPEGLITLAGLYEWWGLTPGEPLLCTATIITRPATDSLGAIHDRMPLVVPAERWDDWLDPSIDAPGEVKRLIAALPDPALVADPNLPGGPQGLAGPARRADPAQPGALW